MPSAKDPTHGYSDSVSDGVGSTVDGAAKLRAVEGMDTGGAGCAAGAGAVEGAPIRHTLSRLMQELPHGFPFWQFRCASAVAGHPVTLTISAADRKRFDRIGRPIEAEGRRCLEG